MTALEELKKRLEEANFNMNRAAEMPAGGKYGAPGIGGEEVLAALLPAGIGMGGRAIGAGVRGFNAAGKRLDPLAEGISGFVTSPSGQQLLGNWGKSALLGKLAKEIENRYGAGSQPWESRFKERQDKQRTIFDRKGAKWPAPDSARSIDMVAANSPYYKKNVTSINVGKSLQDAENNAIEHRQQLSWTRRLLERLEDQGATKAQIEEFLENSGATVNDEIRAEIDTYYARPEGAEVVDFPQTFTDKMRLGINKILDKEQGVPDRQKDPFTRADLDGPTTDPKRWLEGLSSTDVIRRLLDLDEDKRQFFKDVVYNQGINLDEFAIKHYYGDAGSMGDVGEFIENDHTRYDNEDNPSAYRPAIKGLRRELLDNIEGYVNDPDPAYSKNKITGLGEIDVSKEKAAVQAIQDLDYLYSEHDYPVPENAAKLSLNLKSGLGDERLKHIPKEWYTSDPSTAIQAQRTGNLSNDEFQMLQDIRNKPEGQRLPFERKELLRLESRTRWGKEFELWENWEYDE